MISVMTALHIRIVLQIAGNQCFHCTVGIAGSSSIQLNACRIQCVACATTDTSADQCIHLQCLKHSCQCTMSTSVGIYHLRGENLLILHIIDLELIRMSKMLKNLSVFIGYCNSHRMFSFRPGIAFPENLLKAAALFTTGIPTVTELIVAALNSKRSASNQSFCQFSACGCVNLLHRRTGNLHILAALFLGKLLLINQANSLILIHRQNHSSLSLTIIHRYESRCFRIMADPSALSWSWHCTPP